MSNQSLANLLMQLPHELVAAAQFCALPHWFERELALNIVKQFVDDSELAARWLDKLLNLPFVYSHGEAEWQYTSGARAYFCSQLEEQPETLGQLSQFLVRYFEQRDAAASGTWRENQPLVTTSARAVSLERRRVQWQIAYHLAPLNPSASMQRLLLISEWATARFDRLPDFKLVVDVWHERDSFLAEYRSEGVYLEGVYAYRQGNSDEAELKFEYVWQHRPIDPVVTANAGHLLGVIWRQKGRKSFVVRAEQVLRESLTLSRLAEQHDRDTHGLRARILNSLGATLMQLGEEEQVEEAETLLRQALALSTDSEQEDGRAHVLNTLGTLLARTERPIEAEKILWEALQLSQARHASRNTAIIRSSIADLIIRSGERERFEEAEELLRLSLDDARRRDDMHQMALLRNRMGILLIGLGDSERYNEASEQFQLSQQLWYKLGNPQGQAEAMNNLASLWESLNFHRQASRLRRQAAQLSADASQN